MILSFVTSWLFVLGCLVALGVAGWLIVALFRCQIEWSPFVAPLAGALVLRLGSSCDAIISHGCRSLFSAVRAHMPVDDSSAMLLRTPAGKIDFLHVSYTEWKSKSSFKTYGRSGKAKITDPRGSYGMEALVCDRTRPEIDPPETAI
jgi:hypothetical protein